MRLGWFFIGEISIPSDDLVAKASPLIIIYLFVFRKKFLVRAPEKVSG